MSFAAVFDHWNILATVGILSLPVYWLLGRFFFDDWQDFLDHLRLWYQPFWLSVLRGEFNADMWAEIKLLIYFLACAAWVFALSNILIKMLY
jgi:hypothetical protein